MPEPSTSVAAVRSARRTDAGAMAEVHVAAWQRAYAGLLPDAFLAALSVASSAQRWTAALAEAEAGDRSVRYLVAEDNGGEVAGICAVGAPRDDEPGDVGELRMMNVRPSRWGTDVAPILLHHAERELFSMGYRHAYLWVLEGNERARRFYRRCGWTQAGAARTDARFPGAPRELQYRKTLRGP